MTTDNIEDLITHWIQTNAPAEGEKWLQQVRLMTVPRPSGSALLDFREAATHMAQVTPAEPTPDKKLAWARLALDLSDEIMRRHPEPDADMLLSAMALRSRMIETVGVRPGDPILDPDHILRWFLSSVKSSATEVAIAAQALWVAADAAAVSHQQVATLRSIKNCLSIVKGLVEQNGLPVNSQLEAWLKLYDQLP